jgi:CRP-like cAMP-binding protein
MERDPLSALAVISPDSPHDNHLLAALPAAEFGRLAPHLERLVLRLGETLYVPGEQLQHVYFPTTAILSLLYVIGSGASTELASVGNEGVLGIAVFLGGNTTPSSAVVQTAGVGYRMRADVLQAEFNRALGIRHLLLRYTLAFAVHVGRTASCNRHHSIEQQLCRWLLLTLDRLPSNDVVMTHELVAAILGVRRESITAAAGRLQRAGVLRYRRGHIAVLGRRGLEAAACECYAVVRHEYRLLRSAAGVYGRLRAAAGAGRAVEGQEGDADQSRRVAQVRNSQFRSLESGQQPRVHHRLDS